MPPTLPLNVARIAVEGGYGGTTFANVFHFAVNASAEPDTSTLDDLANQVGDAYHTNLMPLMWHTCVLTQVSLQILWGTSPGIMLSTVVSRSDAGSKTGTAAPSSLAGVISWSIAEAYRGGHGRTYMGGLEEGDLADINHVTGSYVTAANAAAAGFTSDMNAFDDTHWDSTVFGIVRTRRSKLLLDPPEFAPITGHRVSNRIRTQRRRLNPH